MAVLPLVARASLLAVVSGPAPLPALFTLLALSLEGSLPAVPAVSLSNRAKSNPSKGLPRTFTTFHVAFGLNRRAPAVPTPSLFQGSTKPELKTNMNPVLGLTREVVQKSEPARTGQKNQSSGLSLCWRCSSGW